MLFQKFMKDNNTYSAIKKNILLIFMMIFCTCQQTEKNQIISRNNLDWLTSEAERQLSGCVIIAHDGTHLYTPDGDGNYAALWTRDFCYMVENAFDLIPTHHIREAILYLVKGQRDDGCMPDRVQSDGLVVFCAGPVGSPLGNPPLDNSQFMVKLLSEYVPKTGDIKLFEQISNQLVAGMDYLPRSQNGLIYNDPENPHSPYGFTDTIGKTGELLFSSLLYWEACQKLIHLFEQVDDLTLAKEFTNRAHLIEQNLDNLWDEKTGTFVAASIDCNQIDIWGNAYAIYIGYPLAEKKDRIISYLVNNFDNILYQGQIRHLPKPDYWQKTLIPIKPETYQNGAYWGTASGWIAFAVWKKYPDLSRKIFHDLILSYQKSGAFECINQDYKKINYYVASVTNPLGAIKKSEKK
jgi:hypothetical protein